MFVSQAFHTPRNGLEDNFDLQCGNKRVYSCVYLHRARDKYFSRILTAKISSYCKSEVIEKVLAPVVKVLLWHLLPSSWDWTLESMGVGTIGSMWKLHNISAAHTSAGTELHLPITLRRNGISKAEQHLNWDLKGKNVCVWGGKWWGGRSEGVCRGGRLKGRRVFYCLENHSYRTSICSLWRELPWFEYGLRVFPKGACAESSVSNVLVIIVGPLRND